MSVQTLPAGWSPDQLAALNELTAMRDAYNVLRDIKQLTGDTTPEAQKVMDDFKASALAVWNRVKTYPKPV